MALERWTISRHKAYKRRGIKLICLLISLVLPILSVSAEEGSTNVYHRHDNNEMKIALTFDDGPHPVLTPKILDILKEYQVKATFFIVGENAVNYPDIVERILKEGHEIGNHTHTHDKIDREEIERCEKTIYELTDYKTKLFRPPEGLINNAVRSASSRLGYDIILWNIDTRDWDPTSPNDIYKNVTSNISAGSIILMHDYISFNSPTPEALKLMLPKLIDMGYQFVVVSELIGTV